jgi:cyclomaltodextrinase / maltogenic alpha-amylase / neopullulanase
MDHADGFIFGTLGDEGSRADYERARRNGVSHRRLRKPRDPRPGEDVVVELQLGPKAPPGEPWLEVEGEGRRTLEPAGVEWDTLIWAYVRRFQGMIAGRPAGSIVRYRLGVGDQAADEGKVNAYAVDDAAMPAWACDAVVYHVFVDRFFSGDEATWPAKGTGPAERYGGTLEGLRQKLDHISALGADTLWLSPIHPSPTYHGYDATDLFAVSPTLGTLDDFDRLLADAHGRSIRLLLDFVPNHWSRRHPTFVAATEDRNSPYVGWYTFKRWPSSYESFFGHKPMPRINYANGDARKHVLDAVRFWLDRGVDGYRVDFALGPDEEFWPEFRQATEGAWTFGEVVETPPTQLSFAGFMDGCLDFGLLEALRATFAHDVWNAARFAAFLDAHEEFFPSGFSRPSFLDNHDMNRFLWSARGDVARLRLAATCQFTLAQPPVIYYGTEVGLSQDEDIRRAGLGGDKWARLPMLWGDDQDGELFAFYRSLVDLRRSLGDAPRRTLGADATSFAYSRGGVDVSIDLDARTCTVTRDGVSLLPEPASV